MDKKQKYNLIENLLANRFNIETFKEFTANIINTRVRDRKLSEAVWKEYRDYIENYQVIGEYSDSNGEEINVIVVKIKEEKDKIISPIRARSKQRNFIAKFLHEYDKTGALVAFYNNSYPTWRLSFIKQELLFTSEGIANNLTPAKRSSFIVGEGEPNHTPISQFMNLGGKDKELELQELEEIFKLEKVTDEFFKEYKNKYLDLKEHLKKSTDFIQQAKNMGDDLDKVSEAFAKKLMGQLSFLYFLQKKGWLGVKVIPTSLNFVEYKEIFEKFDDRTKEIAKKVFERKGEEVKLIVSKMEGISSVEGNLLAFGFKESKYYHSFGSGDSKFIRTLFNRHRDIEKTYFKGRNFFNDYLEYLFYDALNMDRGKIQYFIKFNCRIPFLNGGLFEPEYDWKNTDFKIPDDIFSNGKDGILDIFDRYNFTISENEPYETEIAVDPEMLGKVFENLLDVSDRKSKGAFYTPREIVHYMCKESLINYLDNELDNIERIDLELFVNEGEFLKEADLRIFNEYRKDKSNTTQLTMPKSIMLNLDQIEKVILEIKVADPAIGSGAFPLGMLNEIVKLRSILTDYYLIKEWAEKENFKGSKLSSEEEKTIEKKILIERNLYDLKLNTIENSLYGVDIEPSAVDIAKLRMWLSIVVDAPKEDVKPLPNLDFNFKIGNSLLDELDGIKLFNEELLDTSAEINGSLKLKQLGLFQNFKSKQDDIVNTLKTLHHEYFMENNSKKKKEKKDEIENIEWQLIELTLKESGNGNKLIELERLKKEKRKPYFLWKLEFAEVFQKKGGFDIVIGNPPYGAKINKKDLTSIKKKYISNENNNSVCMFMDFSMNYWANKNGITTMIVPKSLLYSEKWFKLVLNLLPNTNLLVDVEKAFERVKLEQVFYCYNRKVKTSNYLARKFLNNRFLNTIYIDKILVQKYKSWICGVSEEELGIVENLDIDLECLSNISETKRGVGIQSLIKEEGDVEIIGGKETQRYIKKGIRGYISPEDLAENSRKVDFMMQKKIISQDLIAHIQNPYPHIKLSSFLDETGSTIGLDTVQNTVITNKKFDYYYILGLLNSNFVNWYAYKFIYSSAIRTMHFDKNYIGKIIIPDVELNKQEKIINLVKEIIKRKKLDENTENLENMMNIEIYKLYNLSSEKYNIIDKNF